MKKSFILLLAILLLPVVLGCGDGEATQPGETENREDITAADRLPEDIDSPPVTEAVESGADDSDTVPEGPVVYLELCYATSINMPEEYYGPANVFDNDTTTYWATMPGAGPDEGLYFAFEEPVDIYSIRIRTVPESDSLEGIEYFELYINGVQGSDWHSGEHPLWIDAPVKTVFIRVNQTVSMNRNQDTGIRYTGELPVGISEVTLLVADDEEGAIPLRVMPVREVSGTVRASSSLEPLEAYCTDFLFDSRPAFGWADGNEEDTGEGENLVFMLDRPRRIEKIKIWNGYQRSETHFRHNERMAEFSFGPEGEDPGVYSLQDTMEPQVIILDYPISGSSFVLDVLEVYAGEVYRDLVVSELRFFDGDEWFVIDTGESETRKLEVLEWARNNPAGVFLDKQLYLHRSDYEEYFWYTQTMVIRSNGSFVLWKSHEFEDGEEHMYADGNWQILSDDALRVFGRLHRVGRYGMDPYDPYAGSWPDQGQNVDRMTIFSDTLRFGEGWIGSDRGLFEDFTF